MSRTVRTLMPLIVSLLINMTVTLLLQQFLPAAAENASGLAALCALCTLPCMLVLYREDRRGAGAVPAGKTGLPLICFCLAAALLGAAASAAAGRLMEAAGVYKNLSNDAQEQLYSASLWIQIAGPGLLVPISEEMTYRVVFYNRLRENMPRFWAVLIVSFLFAAGHGNWIQAMYAFPMSLLLCAAYDLCGSPLGPAAMHVGANLLSILITVFPSISHGFVR